MMKTIQKTMDRIDENKWRQQQDKTIQSMIHMQSIITLIIKNGKLPKERYTSYHKVTLKVF